MKICDAGEVSLHWCEDGDPDGPPVVFANSLGTDLRLWDDVVSRMSRKYRLIRFDKRGHGLSDVPPAPYSMGALVTDTERLIEHAGAHECVFVGLSIGGMIAQALAVKRPDLIRGMVISNTAAKIGTKAMWEERIRGCREEGIESLADAVIERWFAKEFRSTPELRLWRNMLTSTPLEGYVGCAAAISGTDLLTPTSGLRLPTLAIAGSEDGSTPPDLVRETADLVPGSKFRLIRGAGHLPCVEKPDEYARLLATFLEEIAH